MSRDPVGGEPRVNRRKFVQGAAAASGALVASNYVKPGVRALGVSGAHAAVSDPSDEQPPEPPPPQSEPYGKVPSHAIFLVDCDGKRYGLKLDGTSFDKIAPPHDRAYLQSLGFTWLDPTDDIKSRFSGLGGPGVDDNNERSLVLSIPSGCSLVSGSAFSFDGGVLTSGSGGTSPDDKVYFYGGRPE